MSVITAQQTGIGFAAGFDRVINERVSVSKITDSFLQVIDFVVSASVNVRLAVSSLVQLQDLTRAIAGGFFRVGVKAYKITVGVPIPADLETLDKKFDSDYQFPYDSNTYVGRVSEKIEIPLAPGRYLLQIIIFNTVNIPRQPVEKNLQVFDRIDVSGVPSDKQEEFLTNIVAGIGEIMETLNTELTRLNDLITIEQSQSTGLDAAIDDVKAAVELMHTSVGDKLDILHTDLA